MSGFDFDRPYVGHEALRTFSAVDVSIGAKYGKIVKAGPMVNIEYKFRFDRFGRKNNMKPPPGVGRIFPGYLVIRRLGTPQQYETWMPDHVFEELYVASEPK